MIGNERGKRGHEKFYSEHRRKVALCHGKISPQLSMISMQCFAGFLRDNLERLSYQGGKVDASSQRPVLGALEKAEVPLEMRGDAS